MNTYQKSLTYLNCFLNLERITWEPRNRLWNLDRMRHLLEWFGRPEEAFFPVLIAGTKGKGSTGFFLESILRASGIRTGFYSSPHLEDVRERIRVSGRKLPRSKWTAAVARIRRLLHRHRLPRGLGEFTYFEILTLMAVLMFREAGVEIAIFEVGMGGRLDATNALHPPLVILTPIHLDHEAILGYTVAAIAKEKAAIIRKGSQAVISPQLEEAAGEIRRRASKVGARLWRVAPLNGVKVGLAGDFQRINAAAAAQAARLLGSRFGFQVPREAVRLGLQRKDWPGRLEVFKGAPTVILDGAHNPSSVKALVRNLKRLYPKKRGRLVVFGVARDKKSLPMLRSLGGFFPEAVLAPLPNPRSQEMETLLAQARGHFRRIFPCPDIREALDLARRRCGTDGLVVVTGSFYLIGEARRILAHGRPAA